MMMDVGEQVKRKGGKRSFDNVTVTSCALTSDKSLEKPISNLISIIDNNYKQT